MRDKGETKNGVDHGKRPKCKFVVQNNSIALNRNESAHSSYVYQILLRFHKNLNHHQMSSKISLRFLCSVTSAQLWQIVVVAKGVVVKLQTKNECSTSFTQMRFAVHLSQVLKQHELMYVQKQIT